ncbi:hypothetical protein Pyn_25957 [Prunus yedoensis var. nudiflora]|uniref:Uncharacterized protein n=1 Tax=Prunus yedoensis var. nudiflora TaxID=2094558 RepID=A0A314YXR9_PRUYE|nr:hypothetical protein Pyn_25957 [Prunus yedoensis var. nudiflora]
MALVYEYVANGNLQQHLSADVTQDVLTWKERLQIAVDTARELITGRAAITRDEEDVPIHICQWMCPKFESMEIESIVDSRLQGSYLNSSARKAIEIAMACASSTAIQRPDITVVHNDLKECLEIEMPFEITEIVESDDASSSSSVTMASNIESQTDIAVLECYTKFQIPCTNSLIILTNTNRLCH